MFNVFLPGVGWLAGMILACGLPRREPPAAYLPLAYCRSSPASAREALRHDDQAAAICPGPGGTYEITDVRH